MKHSIFLVTPYERKSISSLDVSPSHYKSPVKAKARKLSLPYKVLLLPCKKMEDNFNGFQNELGITRNVNGNNTCF